MKKLLYIKHWQLFLLLIIVPVVLEIITVVSTEITRNPSVLFKAFPIMMILITGIFMGWLYTLGTNLYIKLPVNSVLNLKTFKIFVLVPTCYMMGISILIAGAFNGGLNKVNPFFFLFMLPLHLFSMFCIFYSLYFIAKAMKTVEMKHAAHFSDYIGEFFLLWFFPVGVWILQPRINKIFDRSADAGEITGNNIY